MNDDQRSATLERRQQAGGDAPVFRLVGISRSFRQGRTTLRVLKDVDLQASAGELVALVGPSGSGKSTLLHIAGLLEQPDHPRREALLDQCAVTGVLRRIHVQHHQAARVERGRVGWGHPEDRLDEPPHLDHRLAVFVVGLGVEA